MSSRRVLVRGLLAARSNIGPQAICTSHHALCNLHIDDDKPSSSVLGVPAWQPGLPYAMSQSRHLSWWGKPKPSPAATEEIENTITPEPPVSIPEPGLPTQLPLPETSTEAISAIHEACGAVEEAALTAARDDSMLAGGLFIDAFQSLHLQAGLPWWAAIAAVNIATRMTTLPVLIQSQKATARMAMLNLQLLPVKKMQEAMVKAKTRDEQLRVHGAWVKATDELKTTHGPAITRTMLTMFGTLCVNSLVFISIFNAVSSLSMHAAPSLTTGGYAWFTDLTAPDPYYGLPILCSLTTLGMVQYGMNVTGEQMNTPEKAGQAKLAKNLFRGMALLFIPFGSFVPAGVALLWASNSFFSVLVGVALRQDGVRRAVGLPTLKELAEVSDKMQAAMTADPMSFVPPPPPMPEGEPVAPGMMGAGAHTVHDVTPQPTAAAPEAQQQQQVVPPPPAGWPTPKQ